MSVRSVIDVWEVSAPGRAAGRAALRSVLASYLGVDPASLAFERGRHGKPALCGHDVHFSFSHSGSTALVAVSRDRPVGVDVELVKPGRAVDRIARRRFAPLERASLARLADADRDAAFHRCWTGKEAYAKGLGRGLTMGFDSFSLAALVEGRTRCAVDAWQVQQLSAPDGHVAAVAAPGSDWSVDD